MTNSQVFTVLCEPFYKTDLTITRLFWLLQAYQSFYKNHQEFIVNQLGLNHDANMRKMRILTFMQIAETQSEISFKEIQKSMQIEEGEVEEFLIDCKF